MSQNLETLKTMFATDIKLIAEGGDSKSTDAETFPLLDTLTEAEQTELDQYCDQVLVDNFDNIMDDASPELRKMIDVYVADMIGEQTGGARATNAEREAVVMAVPAHEAPFLLMTVESQAVQARIRVGILKAQAEQNNTATVH